MKFIYRKILISLHLLSWICFAEIYRGTVVDSTNETGIDSVKVTLKGTTMSVYSDSNGKFSINTSLSINSFRNNDNQIFWNPDNKSFQWNPQLDDVTIIIKSFNGMVIERIRENNQSLPSLSESVFIAEFIISGNKSNCKIISLSNYHKDYILLNFKSGLAKLKQDADTLVFEKPQYGTEQVKITNPTDILVKMVYIGSITLSDSDEEQLGAEFHQQLLESSHIYPIFDPGTDPQKIALKRYLDSVFNSVYVSIPEEDIPLFEKDKFVLTIIDQDVVNAFAVPGGYLYIFTGSLSSMADESELAGVLAHEIVHITRHHYRQTAVKTGLVSVIVNAVDDGKSSLANFVRGSFGLLSGNYMSRDHEYEADEYGTNYLAFSQRNPRGLANYFSRNNGWHPEVLKTYPSPPDRITQINNQVDNSSWDNLDTDDYKFKSKFEFYTSILK